MHPEWDWMETPVGMVYIDTRRQDDRVWVRVADFILPNIHQFPPNADPMAQRNSISRPMATTWAVPLDDTHTMQIGYYRAPENREVRRGNGFGQDASRPYEERQRVPGDYEAQISIHGGVARHGLEHLASTDRGIIMMRNMIRRGIRAAKSGKALKSPMLANGKAVPTYSHDRIVAGILIAELGTDMTVFHSARHVAAWTGLCPGNNESATNSPTIIKTTARNPLIAA